MHAHHFDFVTNAWATRLSRRATIRRIGGIGFAGIAGGAFVQGSRASVLAADQSFAPIWITPASVSWSVADAARSYTQFFVYRGDLGVPWIVTVHGPTIYDHPAPDFKARLNATVTNLYGGVQEVRMAGSRAIGQALASSDPMPAIVANVAVTWFQATNDGAYTQLVGNFADGTLWQITATGIKRIDPLPDDVGPQLQTAFATLGDAAALLQTQGMQLLQEMGTPIPS